MTASVDGAIHKAGAVYHKSPIAEFRDNPLIEALPPPEEKEAITRSLLVYPEHSESDRYLPGSIRLQLTQRIINCHVPGVKDLEIAAAIDRCLRWGYENRNPVLPSYAAAVSGNSVNYFGGYHPNAQGFSIIGVSGIGKTTTVEAILARYPQVIRHSRYEGIPLPMVQVTWLKLDCPADGSLKSLCLSFFEKIDRLAGTSYFEKYRRYCTLDQMQIVMPRVCASLNVGILVIDEIQHLKASSKNSPQAALNFFVTLSNTIGIPVILIGTPSALNIFQSEFQQAKRGSGQGNVFWGRMPEKGSQWGSYLSTIWPFQYTRSHATLTKDLEEAFYEESQGIPFIASHLYKLTQEDAIQTGAECFTAKDVHRVADQKLGLTRKMRRDMRDGKDVDLRILEENAAAFHLVSCSMAEDAGRVPVPAIKENVRQDALLRLLRLDIPEKDAVECVTLALAQQKEPSPAELLANRAAKLYFSGGYRKKEPAGQAPAVPTGYETLKQQGLVASGQEV